LERVTSVAAGDAKTDTQLERTILALNRGSSSLAFSIVWFYSSTDFTVLLADQWPLKEEESSRRTSFL